MTTSLAVGALAARLTFLRFVEYAPFCLADAAASASTGSSRPSSAEPAAKPLAPMTPLRTRSRRVAPDGSYAPASSARVRMSPDVSSAARFMRVTGILLGCVPAAYAGAPEADQSGGGGP